MKLMAKFRKMRKKKHKTLFNVYISLRLIIAIRLIRRVNVLKLYNALRKIQMIWMQPRFF